WSARSATDLPSPLRRAFSCLPAATPACNGNSARPVASHPCRAEQSLAQRLQKNRGMLQCRLCFIPQHQNGYASSYFTCQLDSSACGLGGRYCSPTACSRCQCLCADGC